MVFFFGYWCLLHVPNLPPQTTNNRRKNYRRLGNTKFRSIVLFCFCRKKGEMFLNQWLLDSRDKPNILLLLACQNLGCVVGGMTLNHQTYMFYLLIADTVKRIFCPVTEARNAWIDYKFIFFKPSALLTRWMMIMLHTWLPNHLAYRIEYSILY